MQEGNPRIGIVGLATYAPEGYLSAAEISERSGIPAEVIVDRFGLKEKRVSAPDEGVSDMCVSAARRLFDTHDPRDIDAVIYFGSHFKEFLVWNAAPKIQHALGIEGFSLELINVSAGAPIALKVVKDMMVSDPRLERVLIVAASKESHLLDYEREQARFMLNFGDGAVAALLERDAPANEVLASSILTDGSFADHVAVFGGGSVDPASHETVEAGMHLLDVSDLEGMREGLDPITVKNFIKVVRESVERSGYQEDDIDLLLPIHFKRSLHELILVELGLEAEQSIYLDHYGHMSAVDPLFSLSMAAEDGQVREGDLIVLLAAGTGYTWAATTVRWGVSSTQQARISHDSQKAALPVLPVVERD